MIILNTIGKRKTSAAISLDEFHKATGILKPHICRTLSSLEQRGMISRATIKEISAYTFNDNPAAWKFQDTEQMIKDPEIDAAFDGWFESYPNQMRKDEARDAYHSVIKSGDATIEDLGLSVKGYSKWLGLRDQKFGREADPLFFVLAHNFLRNKIYKDYVRFLETGTTFRRKGKKETEEAKKRAAEYAKEREVFLEKLYAEGKSLKEIKLEIAEFSRNYWKLKEAADEKEL